jgi:putative hemolysin
LFSLRSSITQPLSVPDSQSTLQLLELFKKERTHLALVVDEYGQLEGLVTMHDVLESIVGDMSAVGETDPYAVARANGSWLLDGSLLIDELKEIFPVGPLPDEDRGYETLAGFVITRLGRVPRTADAFVC